MRRMLLIFLSAFLVFSVVFALPLSADAVDADVSIVFTHDLHSHIEPFLYNGEYVGGFARIKTIIDESKSKYSNTIVVDAGDFSMGTLYQSVFQTQAVEYRLLGELGYDAIAFGNHEFDYGFSAVKNMINAAKKHSDSLPSILCANIDVQKSGLTDTELSALNILDYKIIKKNNYTIAVFGLLGRDAVELSGSSDLMFEDFIDAAKETVNELNSLYSPDVIICISHSGTGDSVNDEDVELAKSVDGIDVIISGHTHTTLNEPIIVNDTIIASCDEYGRYVGNILLNVNDNGVKLVSYSLKAVNDKIVPNSEIEKLISEFKVYTDEYVNKFGYESGDQVIAYSPFEFNEQNSFSDQLVEQPLGNLISDAYIHSIKKAEGDDYIPIDVAVAPNGVIRASIDKGEITVSQIYEISALGIGEDNLSGFPLCSVYLYGYELWSLAEVDASVSSIMPASQLYCSGLRYSANTNRMFLNRVYDCWLVDSNGERVEIVDDKLYRVVSGMYSAKLLSTVNGKSFGILELTPKDKYGNEITVFEDHIVYDTNGAEVKEWKALADYVSSFSAGESGYPTIPEKYNVIEGRKNINRNISFSQIFTHWTFITWLVFAVVNILLATIILVICILIRKNKKKKRAELALDDYE